MKNIFSILVFSLIVSSCVDTRPVPVYEDAGLLDWVFVYFENGSANPKDTLALPKFLEKTRQRVDSLCSTSSGVRVSFKISASASDEWDTPASIGRLDSGNVQLAKARGQYIAKTLTDWLAKNNSIRLISQFEKDSLGKISFSFYETTFPKETITYLQKNWYRMPKNTAIHNTLRNMRFGDLEVLISWSDRATDHPPFQ